jgi:hypothetical protein
LCKHLHGEHNCNKPEKDFYCAHGIKVLVKEGKGNKLSHTPPLSLKYLFS